MLQPRCCYRLCALLIVATAASSPAVQSRRASSSFGRPHIISRRILGSLQPQKQHTAFLVPRTAEKRHDKSLLLLTERLRGGSDLVDSDSSDDDDDNSSDDDAEVDALLEQVDSDSDEESSSSSSSSSSEEDDEATKAAATTSAPPSEPVPVTIKTGTGSKLLDQTIELQTVNRHRNVASLKQSVSRQLPARPPVAAIQLSWNGKVLDDDVLVEDLIDEEDDEDEDEEESDTAAALVLLLDMIPAVDPKFVTDLEQKIPDMTAKELLEAFAINEASVYENTALLMRQELATEVSDDNLDEEGEPSERLPPVSVSFQIREQAARIRNDLETSLLSSASAQEILADDQPPSVKQHQAQQVVDVKGQRVRRVGTSGVKTNWKRKIQQNMNVNWDVTIRHFCLFIFFGWFGGRTPVSRAILLLGAPAVFLLQARPVKFMLKQALYAILDHPPGILLSLLPAPQQKILSLNIDKEMQDVYGDYLVDAAPREEDAEIDEDNDDEYDEVSSLFSEEEDEDDFDEEDDEYDDDE